MPYPTSKTVKGKIVSSNVVVWFHYPGFKCTGSMLYDSSLIMFRTLLKEKYQKCPSSLHSLTIPFANGKPELRKVLPIDIYVERRPERNFLCDKYRRVHRHKAGEGRGYFDYPIPIVRITYLRQQRY